MSLLDAVDQVARECGFDVDTARVVGSSDLTTLQLYAIANRVIGEMARKYDWPQLWKSTSFTLVDGQATYTLPGDYSRYHASTFWDSSERWKVYGPITTEEYAASRGYGVLPRLYNSFTVRGTSDRNILIDPTPDSGNAGNIIIYEYTAGRPVRPKFWEAGEVVAIGDFRFNNGEYYEAETGGTTGSTAPTHTSGTVTDDSIDWAYYDGDYSTFLADTDEPIFQQPVLEQGMLERFGQIKGINVPQLFDRQVEEEFARSRPGKEFSMVDGSESVISAFNGRAFFGRGG